MRFRKPSFKSEKEKERKGKVVVARRERIPKVCILVNRTLEFSFWRFQISPGFRETLADVTAEVGSTVVITCVVCGRPKPAVEWRPPRHINLETCAEISMTTKEDGTAELKIEGVQPHHSGEYACLLSNTWGYATSRSLLTVIGELLGNSVYFGSSFHFNQRTGR